MALHRTETACRACAAATLVDILNLGPNPLQIAEADNNTCAVAGRFGSHPPKSRVKQNQDRK